ncbi:helix-turn-helix domain-containing protein [Nocardia sp. NPDC004278]
MKSVGELLREWRTHRRLSQLDLAIAAEVSARHVSLVETGKSHPSAAMVLRLADHLDVPLRDRNRLLLAAGYAPRYGQRSLDGQELRSARHAVESVLRAHEPFPALAIDQRWNIVLSNDAVGPFLADADAELLVPPINLVRLALHPRGLGGRVVNVAQVRAVLRARLSRQVARTRDPVVAELYDRLLEAGPGDDAALVSIGTEIATPMTFRHRGEVLSLFSTTATFGTALDITLEEISIELYYPVDAQTDAHFRRLQPAPPATDSTVP